MNAFDEYVTCRDKIGREEKERKKRIRIALETNRKDST